MTLHGLRANEIPDEEETRFAPSRDCFRHAPVKAGHPLSCVLPSVFTAALMHMLQLRVLSTVPMDMCSITLLACNISSADPSCVYFAIFFPKLSLGSFGIPLAD